MQYLSFCGWPISLSIMSSIFIHVVAEDKFSFFFFYRDWIIFDCMYVPHSCYPFMFWWPDRFQLYAIVNNAVMEMVLQVFFWDPAFSSFWYILRTEIAVSNGSLIFNFWGFFLPPPPIEFSSIVYHFTFSSIGYKSSNFFTSLPILVTLFFGSGHSDR